MKKITALLKNPLTRETLMFIIFGVLTSLISFIVFYALNTLLGVHHQIANVISWIAGVLFAYFTNRRFVFTSRAVGARARLIEFFSFTAARLVTLALEQGVLFIMIDLLHIDNNLSKLSVTVIVAATNFLLSKLFVFKKKNKKSNEE